MSDKFVIGDVVQLNSGGPKMTIQRLGQYQKYGYAAKCYWFDGNEHKEGYFAVDGLTKIIDENK